MKELTRAINDHLAAEFQASHTYLAMPICCDLLGPGWLKANALVPLEAQPPLIAQLWLLLPRSAAHSKAARLCLRLLRVRINRSATAPPSFTSAKEVEIDL